MTSESKPGKSNWGYIIRAIMEENGLLQEELASRSGLTREHISLIVTGKIKEPKDDNVTALATGFKMDRAELWKKILNITDKPDLPSGSPEIWDKFASPTPLKVSVYPDYARVHAGEAVDAIDYIYIDRPEKAPFNIKSYRINGDCLEPELHDGEYVIVDHDSAIDNGDKVVCLMENQLHVAKLKIIGKEYWLQNRYGTYKMTECQGIAKVIGHYGKEA